jgi:hypothetical protein
MGILGRSHVTARARVFPLLLPPFSFLCTSGAPCKPRAPGLVLRGAASTAAAASTDLCTHRGDCECARAATTCRHAARRTGVVAAAPAPGSLEGFGSTLWFVASFSNEFLGNGPGDETVWRREPATADCRRVRCGAHAPLSTACQPGRVALALQLTGRRNMRTNTLARHTQGPCASPTRSAAAALTARRSLRPRARCAPRLGRAGGSGQFAARSSGLGSGGRDGGGARRHSQHQPPSEPPAENA